MYFIQKIRVDLPPEKPLTWKYLFLQGKVFFARRFYNKDTEVTANSRHLHLSPTTYHQSIESLLLENAAFTVLD